MKEILERIAELAQEGIDSLYSQQQCSEADRMDRFLAETSRHINLLNVRIGECESRVDAFITKAQQAVKDYVVTKPKPKKKVGTVTLGVPKKKVRRSRT